MQTDNDIKKWRILIVEDHAEIAKIYSMFCHDIASSLGYSDEEITITPLGKIALELNTARYLSLTPYHFILLDIGLPDMRGTEVAKGIRMIDSEVIIIAHSAYGNYIAKQCFEAGCNDFLTKGFTYNDLRQVIADHAGRMQRC